MAARRDAGPYHASLHGAGSATPVVLRAAEMRIAARGVGAFALGCPARMWLQRSSICCTQNGAGRCQAPVADDAIYEMISTNTFVDNIPKADLTSIIGRLGIGTPRRGAA